MFDKLQNRFAKIFSDIRGHGKISEKNICFATWRARNFPLILVDVIPREVVEILATLA